MTYKEISDFLSKKENWNPVLEYVHRTRLIIGFILGTWFGVAFTLWMIK